MMENAGESEETEPSQDSDDLSTDPWYLKLAPFRDRNPDAEVARGDKGLVINRPWGDKTVRIFLPEDADALVEALNALYLPPQLTAIWHADNKDLEVIWTALPVEKEYQTRSFRFKYGNREFRCEFSDATSRLLALAEASGPVEAPTGTNHRNLSSLHMHLHAREGKKATARPISFFIRSLAWDTNFVIELVRALNFFMHYFDRHSPTIMVHEETSAQRKTPHPVIYPFGQFPEAMPVGPSTPTYSACGRAPAPAIPSGHSSTHTKS